MIYYTPQGIKPIFYINYKQGIAFKIVNDYYRPVKYNIVQNLYCNKILKMEF